MFVMFIPPAMHFYYARALRNRQFGSVNHAVHGHDNNASVLLYLGNFVDIHN